MLFLRNPYLLYAFAFLLILFTYQLRWSYILPPLTAELYIFILITVFISIYGAFILAKLRPVIPEKRKLSGSSYTVLSGIFIGYILEFIHFGGIPLIFLINKNYAKFLHFGGIPTFHVILVSFTTFYAIHLFNIYLTQKKGRVLFQFLLTLIPPILMINRGMFFTIFFGAFFVFVLSRSKIKIITQLIAVSVLITLFYFFGVAGNYRTTTTNSSKFILRLAQANPRFVESKIPKEFMWTYLYTTTPTANLQNSINIVEPKNDFIEFFLNNLCPDFISKRIINSFDLKIEKPPLIHPWLTVGTMYHKAYNDFGWAGMIIVFFAQFVLVLFTLILINPKSAYFITAIAILNTIIIFNLFSNILVFSAISFQIIWILIFEFAEKLNFHSKFHES